MTTSNLLKNIEESKNNLAVVVGYIMYYDMLEEMNGSFFTKTDRAIEIAKDFCNTYADEEEDDWTNDLDFEETLEEFLNTKIKK